MKQPLQSSGRSNAITETARRGAGLGGVIIAACNASFAIIEAFRRLAGRPSVEQVSTQTLIRYMSGHEPLMVLVDVRDQAERSISRIPGSISKRQYEADPQRYAGKTVVPYCTVGGRSYLYARKLVVAGVAAKNYRDSVLGWIHAGQPLETPDGRPTRLVHPYWRVFKVPSNYQIRT
jgi:rhodanese-related sulfurtransferase